ncbi:MAG: TonB-dependent receptor, partial [Sedimentisphaerales bacterium]|nr:TonB-dependent receptor [Sedimentisphaerales bacterium]
MRADATQHILDGCLIACLMVLTAGLTLRASDTAILSDPEHQTDEQEQDDWFSMSIEELMEVEMAITSASRQAHKLSELSVPVSILTAEDIHYSGLTELPEILQFVPGMDILRIDRRRYAVGIRGLHETFSDRTTLLINGRPADNPIYGGPDFLGLPVPLEDIERVEILRGPGSASWGANALTGVINIVTKSPQDVRGVFGTTTFSQFCDSYSHLRWADVRGKWSWRLSAGYQEIKSSGDALGKDVHFVSTYPQLTPLLGIDRYTATDYSRNSRFDTEFWYQASDATQIQFGGGVSHIDAGDFEMRGFYRDESVREEHVRPFVRLNHAFEDGGKLYVQGYAKIWNANWPSIVIMKSRELGMDFQYDAPPLGDHRLTMGGEFEWDHVNSYTVVDQQAVFPDEPLNEYAAGFFVIDRWQATERLALEAQLRADWFSATKVDWSGRFSGIYSLDTDRRHILRLSTSRAFRTSLVSIREAELHSIPLFGNLYLVNANLSEDVGHEETYSFEAGYFGELNQHLKVRLDSYIQNFDKMLGYRQEFNQLQQAFSWGENGPGADSWGTELELILENKHARMSAWYAYNEFRTDRMDQDIRAFQPSRHKVGLTGRVFLPDGWVANANYRYTDTTPCNPFT